MKFLEAKMMICPSGSFTWTVFASFFISTTALAGTRKIKDMFLSRFDGWQDTSRLLFSDLMLTSSACAAAPMTDAAIDTSLFSHEVMETAKASDMTTRGLSSVGKLLSI
jgi:hypothetical protein